MATTNIPPEKRTYAVCLISGCRKRAPANDAFCKQHRDVPARKRK